MLSMITVTKSVKLLGASIMKASPSILSGVAIGGVVATAVAVYRGKTRADEILREAHVDEPYYDHTEDEWVEPEPLSNREKFEMVWQCYIPAVLSLTTTIVCIVGANTIHLRRQAALASLCAMSEAALKDYKDKVGELFGPGKAQKTKDALTQDRVKALGVIDDRDIIYTTGGDQLCMDAISGRLFKSSIEAIRRAENELNLQFMSEMFISLDEYYDKLGLKPTKLGDLLGWNMHDIGDMIHFDISYGSTIDERPCMVIDASSRLKMRHMYGVA